MEAEKRIYSLDFLKTIATILIFFHHYQQSHNVSFENGINFYGGKFYFGFIVELYFVISGYVTFGYIDRIKNELKFRNFLMNRYIRFFPLLFITVIYTTIISILFKRCYGIPWSNDQVFGFWEILISSLGIQSGWVFTNPCINNPTWYISTLLLCYIIFNFLVYIAKKYNSSYRILFGLMITVGVIGKNFAIDLPLLNGYTSRGFVAFFWGILLADIIKHTILSKRTYILCALIIFGFPILYFMTPAFFATHIDYTLTFIYYSTLIIAFLSKTVIKLFDNKMWRTAAEISYNVYMWHIPIFISIAVVLFEINCMLPFNQPYIMILFLVIAYLFSTFSYYCIDKPIREKTIRYFDKKEKEV